MSCGAFCQLGTLGYHKGVEYPGGTQFANDEDGESVWISPAKEGVAPVFCFNWI